MKKKTYPHIEEGEKSTHQGPQLFRGEGEATLKRRVSYWSVTMTFPSKVQPAGGCFERQTLYGACRVFVLKSSKSQDILGKIGCFTQNGDLSNNHTPTPVHIHKFKFVFYTKWRFEQHPPTHPCAQCHIHKFKIGFLHFGAVVRFVWFRVCCTCTIRYHQYMLKACPLWGVQGCIAPPKFPNLQKKVPQIAVCEQSQSEILGILCIFGQRKSLKFRKGSSFVRIFAKMPTFRKSGRDPLLKNLHPPHEKPWYRLGWSQSNT